MARTITARNPRAEAQAIVGGDYEARVLEPSGPAVTDEPFFADDPVATDDAAAAPILPTGLAAELDWSTWLGDHPAHADWVASRWLGGARRLPDPPEALTETRIALHRLAAYVVAPVRHAANGKFGLRWTHGGFGTPYFRAEGDNADRQVRVDGDSLVDQVGDEVRVAPITSLQAAADFLGSSIRSDAGAEHDSPEVGDVDAPLTIDRAAADFLGQWYGMAFAALESVRSDPASVDPSRPQLWPGHFDPAIEVGDEDHRASYGASPGDPGIDEPYLYVSVWWPDRIGVEADDPAWNAPSFIGAILKLSDFPADTDPVTAAADFWKSTRDRLG
ncbi:MAG: hypothetical protein ACR2QK_09525 [Acidimicrobiales bacterium]